MHKAHNNRLKAFIINKLQIYCTYQRYNISRAQNQYFSPEAQCSRGANKPNINAHKRKEEFQNKPFQVQRVNLRGRRVQADIFDVQTEPTVHFILNLTNMVVSTKRRSMSILIRSNKICSANSSHDCDHVLANGASLKNFTVITLLHQ